MSHSGVPLQVRAAAQHATMGTKQRALAQDMHIPQHNRTTEPPAPGQETRRKPLEVPRWHSHITKQRAFEHGCWQEHEESTKQLQPNDLVTLTENLAYLEGTEVVSGFIKFVLRVGILSIEYWVRLLVILMGMLLTGSSLSPAWLPQRL